MATGALLFGRYAYPPNRLGYCGPNQHEALLRYVAGERIEPELLEMERRFEGAYPYLKVIAAANGIADPLAREVVDAYWLGNSCLDAVDPASFGALLDEKAHAQMGARAHPWLSGDAADAKPHHTFTVVDLYMRTGMLRDARAAVIVKSIDSCRISWGRVEAVEGDELLVSRPALVMCDGRLVLSEPRELRALRQIDGQGFADEVRPGDVVALHWNWVCDTLSDADLAHLQDWTARTLALANAALA